MRRANSIVSRRADITDLCRLLCAPLLLDLSGD